MTSDSLARNREGGTGSMGPVMAANALAGRVKATMIGPGPVEQVSLGRLSGSVLSMTGRRLARHVQSMPWGEDLSISLWQKQKSGYVLDFQVWVDGRLRPHAAALDTLEDSICFLEDFCAGLHEPAVETLSLEQALFDLQRALVWREAFLLLVGEALAGWVEIAPRADKKSRNKGVS